MSHLKYCLTLSPPSCTWSVLSRIAVCFFGVSPGTVIKPAKEASLTTELGPSVGTVVLFAPGCEMSVEVTLGWGRIVLFTPGWGWRMLVVFTPGWRMLVVFTPDWRMPVVFTPDWRMPVVFTPDWRIPVVFTPRWRMPVVFTPGCRMPVVFTPAGGTGSRMSSRHCAGPCPPPATKEAAPLWGPTFCCSAYRGAGGLTGTVLASEAELRPSRESVLAQAWFTPSCRGWSVGAFSSTTPWLAGCCSANAGATTDPGWAGPLSLDAHGPGVWKQSTTTVIMHLAYKKGELTVEDGRRERGRYCLPP